MQSSNWSGKAQIRMFLKGRAGVRTVGAIVVLWLWAAGLAHAGIDQWTTNGPAGAIVRALAVDPSNPAIVYAGTENGGVFKSTDGGAHWTAVNNGLSDTNVRSLVIDPANPRTVYVSTGGATVGVSHFSALGDAFKTSDGGASWTRIRSGDVSAVVIDPVNPNTIYAINGLGVLKSSDAGQSWTFRRVDAVDRGSFVSYLAIDPINPQILYIVLRGGAIFAFSGILKSTDGGITWSDTGLTSGHPFNIDFVVIDPVTPTILYASVSSSLFKSLDGGVTWTGLSFGGVRTLVIDPLRPTTVYAGTAGSQSDPNSGGIFKSIDGGATWTSLNDSLPDLDISALAIDPVTGATLYAGVESGGVFDLQIGGAPPGIMAVLESPENGPVAGIAIIRGWAFATRLGAGIRSIELFIDGRRVEDLFSHRFDSIPCCAERADVQAAFPQFPADNTLHSAWGTTVNWSLLSPEPHTVGVRIRTTSGEVFSDARTVTVVTPGTVEFLDQFALSSASAQIAADELVVNGIIVRDKATQQQKRINTRFRWFTHSQSFGLTAANTTSAIASWRAPLSALFAALPAWLKHSPPLISSALASPGISAVFESPENMPPISGVTLLHGWAFAEEPGATITAVSLITDEEPQGTVPCCSWRQDVAAAFPQNPNALDSGWGRVFNYGILPSGFHTFTVQIEDSSGAATLLTKTVQIVRVGGFEFVDQFDLANATARIEGEEIVLTGVRIRDKANQQIKTIDLRLRWFVNSQALGIVASSS